MYNKAATARAMWRGAKLGALSLGSLGFVGGISLCVVLKLPFPPIATTEIGVILGGSLGALAGYISCFPAGRKALWGALTGAFLGLPAAGLLYGQVALPIWLGWVAMLSLLGYQLGSLKLGADSTATWQVRSRTHS